ncbi:MAG: 2-C-methyl-D-erythritol 2,4-cyclodiphosphate synthase [Candidatus Omnitrophota bacterium]|jgi:2-C-methyl-D-erythritol 2,4-cyclodiphosphate synthase
MKHKVGLGYDVHRFIAGRTLFLGGVEIPYALGLDGHSDADVLLHAICDALLGALGQGDIGEHFPDTDSRYKDIASVQLLEAVYALVLKEGFRINNIDAVVIAEEPHLKSYKEAMRAKIAAVLDMAPGDVNIKATTQEGMGFAGRKEGVAAYATALLIRP